MEDSHVNLSALGVTKERRPLVGVLVRAKGHRDVKLWFDKETGLLAKREHLVLDPVTTKEVSQQVVFGDYRNEGGVKHYHTVTAFRDGRKFAEGKVVEVEFFDKLGAKTFATP